MYDPSVSEKWCLFVCPSPMYILDQLYCDIHFLITTIVSDVARQQFSQRQEELRFVEKNEHFIVCVVSCRVSFQQIYNYIPTFSYLPPVLSTHYLVL